MKRTDEGLAQPGRRRVLASALRFAAAGSAFGIGSGALLTPSSAAAQGAVPPGAAPAGAAPAGPPPLPDGTHLVLLGTRGGPGADFNRGEAASVVVADGVPYLFDCGYGAMRALVASGVGFQRVSSIFFTHLHNDHTSDLAALLSHQWTGNKAAPTEVYGPYGTAALVDAAIAFFKADVEIRTTDEGRSVKPETLFHGHDVAATAAPVVVMKNEHVTISAAQNTHYPERATARMPHRAISLRIDTRARSIVFSGDTAYSENLVRLARGADLFVCEIIAQTVYDANMARAKADAQAGNANSVSRHVAETHSTPGDVGRMASEAQVKTVVLNHQLPGPRIGGLDFAVTTFVDDVRKTFAGEVIVGQDLMVL